MKREQMPDRARFWLYILGGLGLFIVIFSVAVNSINSGTSIVGYVVGFICMLLAAMAAFSKRDSEQTKNQKKRDDE